MLFAALLSVLPDSGAEPLAWGAVSARPLPPPGQLIAYGPAASQFGSLRVPDGDGLPVAVLIHGGCWLAQFDYRYFEHLAHAIHALGFVSWNIEYRRVGEEGGGWPGTFGDVADAIDHVRALPGAVRFDLERVTVIGHSAGGQLALWSASRDRLPTDHPPVSYTHLTLPTIYSV